MTFENLIVTATAFGEILNVDTSGSLTLNGVTLLSGSGGTATVENAGTITLENALTVQGGPFTLELDGAGTVSINGSTVSSLTAGDTLQNNGNTIEGYGQIGDGSGNLALDNNSGTIEANVGGQTLTLDTGDSIVNKGTLEATDGGTLHIEYAVTNSGAGYALVEGGTLEFDAASNTPVTFNNGSGVGAGSDYGELVLKDWAGSGFSGTISGFSGIGEGNSDEVDLVGFTNGTIVHETHTGSGVNEVFTLTLEDSEGATTTLKFKDPGGTLLVEHSGSDTIVFDPPPATATPPARRCQSAGPATTISSSTRASVPTPATSIHRRTRPSTAISPPLKTRSG